MAKKYQKLTKADKYREIISDFDKLSPLAFKFESEGQQHSFHFDIMAAKIPYRLYDGFENNAIMLFEKGFDESKIKEIVEANNGSMRIPNLIFDKFGLME